MMLITGRCAEKFRLINNKFNDVLLQNIKLTLTLMRSSVYRWFAIFFTSNSVEENQVVSHDTDDVLLTTFALFSPTHPTKLKNFFLRVYFCKKKEDDLD